MRLFLFKFFKLRASLKEQLEIKLYENIVDQIIKYSDYSQTYPFALSMLIECKLKKLQF